MKLITLYSPDLLKPKQYAQVDDSDYETLNKFSWFYCKHGRKIRAYTNLCRTQIRMHEMIMGNPPKDGLTVDHWDTNLLNNQRENLRWATRSQQQCNREKYHGEFSSKYKGVGWMKSKNKWYARIAVDKKTIFIGYFKTELDAAKAYNKAAIYYHKEFAQLNGVD